MRDSPLPLGNGLEPMPRTRRYIFNTLTVVSLLLMVATVVLRIGGERYTYTFRAQTKGLSVDTVSRYGIAQAQFAMRIDENYRDHPFMPGIGGSAWDREGDEMKQWFIADEAIFHEFILSDDRVYGFGVKLIHEENYTRRISLSTPIWFLILVFAILPTIWLIKWNKRRKLGPNACPACGYDLTGNETGECPECGHASETEATA